MTKKRCLVLACGALAREIIALREQLGLSEADMVLQCLPAILHNRPALIAPRVEAVLKERRHEFETVLVGYGDCGTAGALDVVLAKYDATRLPHQHCYEFFAGTPKFEAIVDAELGSFFLTDFLARHFERLVIEGLGLDRFPQLRDDYFGHYTRLVYLAQTDDPAITRMAEAGALRLGLAFERRHTGLGGLETFLSEGARRMARRAAHPDPAENQSLDNIKASARLEAAWRS